MKFMQTRTKRAGKEEGGKRKEKRLWGGGGEREGERKSSVWSGEMGIWTDIYTEFQEMGRQNQKFWGSQQLCAKRDKANTAVA